MYSFDVQFRCLVLLYSSDVRGRWRSETHVMMYSIVLCVRHSIVLCRRSFRCICSSGQNTALPVLGAWETWRALSWSAQGAKEALGL